MAIMQYEYSPPKNGNNPSHGIVCTFVMVMSAFLLMTVSTSALEFSIATTFDRAYSDKWAHASSGTAPAITGHDTVYPSLPLQLYVTFSDYSRNNFGIADLAFSYVLVGPDGKKVKDTSGISAFSGIVAADAGTILSECVPAIVFTGKSRPGMYTLRVTAEDRITRVSKMLTKKIVHTRYPSPDPDRFDVVSFNRWVHNYCIAPDPARAISAFVWFAGSGSAEDERILWPVLYFFQSFFHSNPLMIDVLMKGYSHYDPRVKDCTVLLLRLLGLPRAKNRPIDDTRWKKYDNIAGPGYLDPFALTLKSKSSQFMEMGFYYYGQYDMVRFLIACLGIDTRDGYVDFAGVYKRHNDGRTIEFSQDALLRFYTESRAILAKAGPQHRLLRSYCRYALEHDNLTPEVKRALQGILGDKAAP